MEEKKLNDEKLEAVTGGEVKWPNAQNVSGITGDTNLGGVTRTCDNCKNYGAALCPNENLSIYGGKKYSAESCSFFIAKA